MMGKDIRKSKEKEHKIKKEQCREIYGMKKMNRNKGRKGNRENGRNT
jgi:hypothetical protein